jgi:hypothetical protein
VDKLPYITIHEKFLGHLYDYKTTLPNAKHFLDHITWLTIVVSKGNKFVAH